MGFGLALPLRTSASHHTLHTLHTLCTLHCVREAQAGILAFWHSILAFCSRRRSPRAFAPPCSPLLPRQAATFNPFERNTSADACQDCPLGTYQPTPGRNKCFACPPGTFANVTRRSACSKCPAGFFLPESARGSPRPLHPSAS